MNPIRADIEKRDVLLEQQYYQGYLAAIGKRKYKDVRDKWVRDDLGIMEIPLSCVTGKGMYTICFSVTVLLQVVGVK